MFFSVKKCFKYLGPFLGVLSPVFAIEVNPEIGNVTYTAIDCISKNGGRQLYIERFYNSAAKQTGWFGFGHGSQYETYLKKEADGTLSVYEYGQTPPRSFTPNAGEIDTEKMVNQILESKKFSSLGNAKEALKKKLLENRSFRVETAREVGVTATTLGNKGAFHSKDFDGEKIIFDENFYVRTTRDGKSEKFNESGKLVEVKFPQKKLQIGLKYDDKGMLKNISDNVGNQLEVKFGLGGLISTIQSVSDNKISSYSYKQNILEKVTNEKNEVYTYEFDRNLNLVKITKPDFKRPQTLEYDLKTRKPLKIHNPDGSKIEYVYSTKEDKDLTTRTIVQKTFNQEGINRETLKWTYVHGKSELGERILHSRTFDDGIAVTLTTYRSCCYPQPTKIVMGGQSVDFTYDAENRLMTKKYSHGRKLDISYDSKGLISQIMVNDVPYLFKHDLQSAVLKEVQGPDYKMQLGREEGLLRNVSYSLKSDGKTHVAQYTYDKKKRLTAISIDDRPLVKYTYTLDGQQDAIYTDQLNSEKNLSEVDKMMLDSMVLREVNYNF